MLVEHCIFTYVLFCSKTCLPQAVHLDTIQKQLRAAQKQLQRARKKEKNYGCTPHSLTLSLGVYILSGHDVDTAIEIAKRMRVSESGDAGVDDVPWRDVIEELYLQTPPEAELAWHFPEGASQIKRRQAALIWITEYRTMQWVRSQNMDHGVAPASTEVLATFIQLLRQWEGVLRVPVLEQMLEASGRSARQWSLRFRQRWQIKLGRLKVREPCTPEEIHAKVPKGSNMERFPVLQPALIWFPPKMINFWHHAWLPIWDTFFGTQNLDPQ